MGWRVSLRATLQTKVVSTTFSVSGISKERNEKDGNSMQVNSTQLEVYGEVILGYL